MPQHNHANDDSSEADKKDDSASHATIRAKSFGLRWMIIWGCVATVALLFISIFLPNLTERVKFFTVNFLSLLVLAVIVIQAYINKRQWEAMKDSLAETRKMVAQNERVVIASEMQATAAEHATQVASQAMVMQTRPYVAAQTVIRVFEADKPIKIDLSFLNEGNSPAVNLRAQYYAIHKTDPEIPAESDYKGAHTGTLLVLPHRARTHHVTLSPLTSAQVEAIKAETPTLFFFFFGSGKYSGVGGDYSLEFCVMYRREINGLGDCSCFKTNPEE